MKPKLNPKSNQKVKPKSKSDKLKKKDHISYNQIQNGRCLYRYKMINLTGKVKVFNDAMKEGAFVHDVIYEYTRKCVEAGHESDFETISKIFDDKFNSFKIDESRYIPLRNSVMKFAESGVKFDKILDYEKRFEVSDGRWKFTGVIDRVDTYRDYEDKSVIEIIDYKNQRSIYTQEEVETDLQLRLYRYFACEHLYKGFDKIRVGIHHTQYDFVRWGDMVNIEDLRKREFYDIETFIDRQWDRLILSGDDEYIPEPGKVCWEYGQCEVMKQGKCPAFKENKVCDSIEDKVRSIRQIDIERDRLLKSVKEEMRDSEIIEVDGIEVGFKASFSSKYNAVGFIQKSVDLGVPVGHITVNSTDAKKSFKEKTRYEDVSPNYEELYKDIEIITSSNRFVY
jgi:RecB family exonuclease